MIYVHGKRCVKCGKEIYHTVSEDAPTERAARARDEHAAQAHALECGGEIEAIKRRWR